MKRRKLYPHQIDAYQYARRVRNPALLMEMRLGKTLVAIRTMLYTQPLDRKAGLRVLVVAPYSALPGWENELRLEGQTFVCWLSGPRNKRLETLEAWQHNWYLLNKEGFLVVPEIADKMWDAVIVDESFIRNPRAKVTKFFMREFRYVPKRWLLSGTPNPESDLELAPQFIYLNGNFCGFRSPWQFRAQLFRQIGFDWVPTPEAARRIEAELASKAFVLRRRDVPGFGEKKIKETRYLELPPKLKRVYDEAERSFVLKYQDVEKKTKWAMVKWNWLRQLSCGFIDHKLVWKGKLQELQALLQGELRKERAVIWCSYNQDVAAISKTLGFPGITGKTPVPRRGRIIKEFNAGKYRALVLQIRVASFGVDLSSVDTAIYYSETPSAILAQQAEDRLLSASKKGPYLYVYLTTRDTVDEDLRMLMVTKRLVSAKTLALAVLNRQNKGLSRPHVATAAGRASIRPRSRTAVGWKEK